MGVTGWVIFGGQVGWMIVAGDIQLPSRKPNHRGAVMAKIFSIHEYELGPSVNAEEFERRLTQWLLSLPTPPGWKVYYLKGTKGERQGKYALMLEIEIQPALARRVPPTKEFPQEDRRFGEQQPYLHDLAAAHAKLLAAGVGARVTDYVVLGEGQW